MQDQSTTTIRWGENNPQMATDDEIRRAVALARENDLKVILKPTVNIDDGTWRAWVKFYRPLTQQESAAGNPGVVDRWGDSEVNRPADAVDLERWAAWWESFDEFLLHYAQLAEETDCEMLCLGCEMNSTEEFADRWRSLIARVRGVYQGPLTYDVNHHRELEVSWWDAVDLISVSAYYHVPPPAGLTEEEATRYTTGAAEIVAELRKIRDQLAEIHAKHQKPILFIETGVTSVRGCARYPWAHVDERQGDPVDLQEQVNYYQAMFDVFWDEPWFAGFCWWDWPARLYDPDHAAKDRTFCNFGKPAADVMKSWYAKPR